MSCPLLRHPMTGLVFYLIYCPFRQAVSFIFMEYALTLMAFNTVVSLLV
jgi:hypothetical protein